MYYRASTTAAQGPLSKGDIAAHNQRHALLFEYVVCVSATHPSGVNDSVHIKDSDIMEDDTVNISGPTNFRACR